MSVNHYTQDLHNHTNLFSNTQNDTVYNHNPYDAVQNYNQYDAVQNHNQYDAVQNHNQYDAVRSHQEVYELRTSLFEKSLTPSDVGKLNRLVIPKQHAEKHFPLNNLSTASAATAGEPATTEEKGPALMLSFEDESTGKNWEFRYSYWNSSQSYVLTKGWSRYVKHKRLDAGDVIFFKRHRYDVHKLFIGWRRRGGEASSSTLTTSTSTASSAAIVNNNTTTYWNGVMPYRQTHVSSAYSNPLIHPEYSHYGGAVEAQSIPTGTVSARTVRLFGVNLECEQLNDGDDTVSAVEPPCPDGYQGQHNSYYYSTIPHRMNISFGGERMEQVRR